MAKPLNRLEALPVELLYEICGYLLSSHDLRGVQEYYSKADPARHIPHIFDTCQYNASGPKCILPFVPEKHPGPALWHFARTSPHLSRIAESFSDSLLLLWADIVKIASPNLYRSTRWSRTEDLVKWIKFYCVFCGIDSIERRATLANGLCCCEACDDKHWPDKLRVTAVKKIFKLNNEHLFNFTDRPSHWPMIRFAPQNRETTGSIWCLRADAEKLADAVHGNWKLYEERRKLKAEKKKAKEIENKRKHIASGECPGVDGCRYCMEVRDADAGYPPELRRRAPRWVIAYSEIPDDDDDREVWINGMRRTAVEDPNWDASAELLT